MDDWPNDAFEDLLEAPLRSGINAPSRVRGSGVKLVNMGELFAHDRIGDVPMELAPLPGSDPERYLLRSGDLLFARQSLKLEGAGRCCLVMPDPEPRTWEGHIIRARLRPSIADHGFYYYWFRSPGGRAAVASIVEQVAAAGIRGSDLARLSVPTPPLAEQRVIAGVLGALDDKIESNRRLAEVVDQLVRAEVGAALSDGVSGTVADLVANVRSTVQPDRIDPETRYLGLEHMPRGAVILDAWGHAEGLGSAKAEFANGDILFGKLRPYFKKVGLAIPTGGVCSTDILVLRPVTPALTAIALATLASDEFIDFASNAASGTRMPRASWDHMKTFPVQIPRDDAVARLADLLDPLLFAAQRGVEESVVLAELRDALLPELLSGRLRVPVAEDLVESAT